MQILNDHSGKTSSTRVMTVGTWLVGMIKWIVPPMMGTATTQIDSDIIIYVIGIAVGGGVIKTVAENFNKKESK